MKSVCGYCNTAAGKRPCPALSGTICGPCCGQHRGHEIECPPDCRYYGGESRRTVETTPASFHGIWSRLLEFADAHQEQIRAAEERFGEVPSHPDDDPTEVLMSYAFCSTLGWSADRLIDRFDREYGRALPADQRAALGAIRDGWFSIFEVLTVDLDQGMKLQDRLTGETVYVHERSGTHGREKYDTLTLWVGPCGAGHVISGSGLVLNHLQREPVLAAARKELRRLKKQHPEGTEHEVLRELVPAVNRSINETVKATQMPKLTTSDGQEMVFCKAIFDVDSPELVEALLRSHPEFDEDDGVFVWLSEGSTSWMPGPTIIGRFRLCEKALEFETTSRERLEEGKALARQLLGNLARHRVDSMTDPEVVLKERRDRPPLEDNGLEDEIPPEEMEEIITELMRKHYESWLEASIPALGNKTPREAVRTKRGKEKVIELLKTQENTTRRQPGGKGFDFGAIYRELGLEEPK